jgi:hypothetical protein
MLNLLTSYPRAAVHRKQAGRELSADLHAIERHWPAFTGARATPLSRKHFIGFLLSSVYQVTALEDRHNSMTEERSHEP